MSLDFDHADLSISQLEEMVKSAKNVSKALQLKYITTTVSLPSWIASFPLPRRILQPVKSRFWLSAQVDPLGMVSVFCEIPLPCKMHSIMGFGLRNPWAIWQQQCVLWHNKLLVSRKIQLDSDPPTFFSCVRIQLVCLCRSHLLWHQEVPLSDGVMGHWSN